MKKFTYLIGSLLLAGSLVACGGGGASTEPTEEDTGNGESNEEATGSGEIDTVEIAIGSARVYFFR